MIRLFGNSEKISELEQTINSLNIQIDEIKEQLKYKDIIINNSIPYPEHNQIISEYQLRINELEQQLHKTQNKVHNERNAGRKSRATQENLQQIMQFRENGFSMSEIAKHMTNITGDNWSKSTIGFLLKRCSN